MEKIKCVVWDLDNTLWDGTLLEDKAVSLSPQALRTIKTLDERGILQSIASKNDYSHAFKSLEQFGISEYFLYPQISWGPKSDAIATIVEKLNIGMDTVAFVDDQPFEIDEVRYSHPLVYCIHADQIPEMLAMECMQPRFVTEDSRVRRQLYQNDIMRNQAEDQFRGPKEEFLETLNMRFSIRLAKESDLRRMEELTVRTHQLNSTGYTYSYEELNILILSPDYIVLVAELEDRYGPYGTIGLSVIEIKSKIWHIRLLLMSCRTVSRGVGSILLNYLILAARDAGVLLRSEFRHNDRNRMMYVAYKFAGFQTMGSEGEIEYMEHRYETVQRMPEYIEIHAPAAL